MPENFQVIRRNFGHWDILVPGKGRAFRIRGEPGAYIVMDERTRNSADMPFKTVTACMTYICEIFMYENVQLKNSNPTVIDRCGNPVEPVHA